MIGSDIKHRINAANETVKITRAMQLIATAKITRAQKNLEGCRYFRTQLETALYKMGKCDSVLCKPNGAQNVYYFVVADDKGLCGDYNNAVLAYAAETIGALGADDKIFAVGHVTREFFKKKGIKTSSAHIEAMHHPFTEDAKNIAEEIIALYKDGKVGAVKIIYTLVGEKTADQTPREETLLPLSYESDKNIDKHSLANPKSLESILNEYLWTKIYYATCNAFCAVHYKRMIAMQQATNNGAELSEELVVKYNRVRQESITNELIDAAISKQGRFV